MQWPPPSHQIRTATAFLIFRSMRAVNASDMESCSVMPQRPLWRRRHAFLTVHCREIAMWTHVYLCLHPEVEREGGVQDDDFRFNLEVLEEGLLPALLPASTHRTESLGPLVQRTERLLKLVDRWRPSSASPADKDKEEEEEESIKD